MANNMTQSGGAASGNASGHAGIPSEHQEVLDAASALYTGKMDALTEQANGAVDALLASLSGVMAAAKEHDSKLTEQPKFPVSMALAERVSKTVKVRMVEMMRDNPHLDRIVSEVVGDGGEIRV